MAGGPACETGFESASKTLRFAALVSTNRDSYEPAGGDA